VLAAGGLAALPAGAAPAVSSQESPGRPIAVAVAVDGTAYAGFATGGRLLRLSPGGDVSGAVPLDRDQPVTALDVDATGSIWVDYGDAISRLDADGTLQGSFALDPAVCPVDAEHDPASYGGIAITADAVYVAGRCTATVSVYDHDGGLQASLDLPGTELPRGIAVAPAHKRVPARLYVAVPDTRRVHMWDLAKLRGAPAQTLQIAKDKAHYTTPVPGGLAADAKGQLIVADTANHALYFYDATKDYHFYRTLGHPPTPAPDRGHLHRPSAIDQAGQSLQGHLWIADTGNGRIQRWSTDGTTQWMTEVQPPADVGAPVSTAAPTVAGTPTRGSELRCSPGTWEPEPSELRIGWLRDGLPIGGAAGPAYVITGADLGSELACAVTAVGAGGERSAPVESGAFPVPGPDAVPFVLTRPTIRGTPAVGEVLHCSPGTWTDLSPRRYVRGWLRGSQLLPGTNAPDYLVTDSDLGHELSCRVVAVNDNGASRPALSDPVVVAGGGGGGAAEQPHNDRRPEIVGRTTVGSEVFCDPGRWTGAPVFTYVWRRDGANIGGAGTDTYTIVAADRHRSLTCAVTGTNALNAELHDTAVSPAIVPVGAADPDPEIPDDPGSLDPDTIQTCRGKPRVVIDGGRRWARDRWVTLKVRAPAKATAVVISNDRKFRRADTKTLVKSCRYEWTLPKGSGPKPKTVWIKYVGASGRTSGRIRVDAVAPVIRRITGRWRPARHGWVVKIRATDRGSGIATVTYGRSRTNTETRRWPADIVSWDSSWLQWFRVTDRAGHTSRWYRLRL